jgi:hypothetical protein
MKARYCIDTSSILEAWARRYPRDVFQGFWDDFEELAASGHAIIAEEVFKELTKKDDGAAEWAASIPGFVVDFDQQQETLLIPIMGRFPKLAKEGSNRNRADPFVIALAQMLNIVVVTQEDPGTENKPKIPWVCDQLKVEWIDIIDLIRVEGWTYGRPTKRRR